MQQQKTRVLIADDDLHVRSLLSILVESLDVDVIEAEDGVDALEKFESHYPDMLLLDLNMPRKGGYEVCETVKANPAAADIPVIFITAESDTQNEVRGLEMGAVDFISKPIEPAIVLARISTHLALQSTRRELEEKNLILGDEKELMEDIVTKMRLSSPFNSRQVRYIQSSVDRTAGDIVLSAFAPNGVQHILIGDFSGHGLPAAMGGMLAPYIFYHLTAEERDMQRILTEINQVLYEQLPTQLYLAASALEISANRQTVKVWNYGLPAVMQVSEQTLARVGSSGLPLGIMVGLDEFMPHKQFSLKQGDAFYIYTDGLTEAMSETQEQYGVERLEALVREIYQDKLSLDTIWQALDAHCKGRPLADDAVMFEVIL